MKLDVKIPELGESISEATIGTWLKQDGDAVEMDEIICEIESEKATVELPAENAGIISILISEGETVAIGSIIAAIETNGVTDVNINYESAKAEPENSEQAVNGLLKEQITEKTGTSSKTKITPVAQNILKSSGIDAENIPGTGAEGRITKQDVLAVIDAQRSDKQQQQIIPTARRTERREKMTTLRRTISRRLLEAKNNTAMLTTINEVDMSAIKELRVRYKEPFKEKHGIGLGFMSFFAKAVSLALQEFPVINASIDKEDIVYHDFHDIGIAVSTDRGLVVPVVRDVQNLSMADIEKEIDQLASKARDNKLSIDEMTGGTFSITNGGVFGSLISTPLINIPQSAILGMHTIQDRPVVRDGEIVIRPMMYIALSYDHRLIDGKESVSFVMRLKEILEDPVRLLLDV